MSMKQEDKELLLKDLCARLPYGIKLLHTPTNEITNLDWNIGIPDKSGTYLVTTIFDVVDICHFKDGEWQIYDNEEIVAWCLMDNIKPYKKCEKV